MFILWFNDRGWYHQVVNIGQTLSINHNWINSHNLSLVLDYLLKDYSEIQELIKEHADMDDFEQHCQKILKANCGMNIDGFLEMIQVAINSRINRFKELHDASDYYSLECIANTLESCSILLLGGLSYQKILDMKGEIDEILTKY